MAKVADPFIQRNLRSVVVDVASQLKLALPNRRLGLRAWLVMLCAICCSSLHATSSVEIEANYTQNTSRTIMRSAAGNIYAVIMDTATSTHVVRMYESTSGGASWSQLDSAHAPSGSSYSSPSAGLDGNGIIHIAYWNGAAGLRYVTFSTTTNTFSGDAAVAAFTGGSPTTPVTALAVDSNNATHILYEDIVKVSGKAYQTVTYINNVGSTWNTKVQIYGASSKNNGCPGDIIIDQNNLPEVAFSQCNSVVGPFVLEAAIGNVNKATTFTTQSIVSSAYGTPASMTMDSAHNTWVGYESNQVSSYSPALVEHRAGDAWTTWQAPVVDSGASVFTGVTTSISIAANGTAIFVAFPKPINLQTSTIAWQSYSGSTWSPVTTLDQNTWNPILAWSNYFNHSPASGIDLLIASGGPAYWNAVSTAVISGISPSSGSAGTAVTISGSNLGTTGTVTFNGIQASTTSWSSTSIGAIVPVQATSGNVYANIGGINSAPGYFVVPAPTISSISPSTARGTNPVVISGTGFGSSCANSVVTFSNNAVASTSSCSDTSLAAITPTTAVTGPVTVGTGGGTSSGYNFTVIPPPNITTLSPTSGTANTTVTISGSSFGALQGNGTVQFGTTQATPMSWSDSRILVPVPTGASSGNVNVVVTAGGEASNGVTFNVVPGPSITSLSPTSGASGTAVQITGNNFGSTQGNSLVRFNGIAAANISSWSGTSVTAVAPAEVTTGPVTVAVNGQISNGQVFTVQNGGVTGVVTRMSDGTGLQGATIGLLQAGSTKFSAQSAAGGSYSIANVPGGVYDMQVSATGYGTYIQYGLTVTGGNTATQNVSLSAPSTISGAVTQSDGVTPISGATVRAYSGDITDASTTTNALGSYSLSTLNAGSYSIEASATGFVTETNTGVSVSGGGNTTSNFSLQTTGTSPISYDYDELGRLIAVTDQAGDTAVYNYDAVGNILSISRQSSSQLAIVSFTPKSGPVGTVVTIAGTAFNPNPAQDTVLFNGTSATITSATATQIVATVPAGATTGVLTVTTPAGSVSSASQFVVSSSPGAPTITNFSPSIQAIGSPTTISGTNFDAVAANDNITINTSFALASSVSPTSITATVPANTSSGHISVKTLNGQAVTSGYLFVPPPSYPVTSVASTGAISFGGIPDTINFPSAGQIGLAVFDGTAGQRVFIGVTDSFNCCVMVSLINPRGATIASNNINSSGYVDATVLPTTGTYTILVVPSSGLTGNVTLSLYSVTNIVGTITADGTPVNGTITTPGQIASYSFSGTAGQQVSATLSGNFGGCCVTLSILNPNSTTLTSGYLNNSGMVGPVTLPSSGTYTVVVNVDGALTGSFSLALYTVTNITGSISANGTPVNGTITTPGQIASYTFSGTSGQSVSLTFSANFAGCCVTVSILNPDSTTLKSAYMGDSGSIGATTLPASGSYTVVVDPDGSLTGSFTVTLTTN